MQTSRLTIMIDPALRDALQELADRDCRSLSDMLKVCAKLGMVQVRDRLEAADARQQLVK